MSRRGSSDHASRLGLDVRSYRDPSPSSGDSQRSEILGLLRNLPQATSATDVEVLTLIANHQLFGRGIGYVDAHLLAATMLTTDARLGRERSDSRWWPPDTGSQADTEARDSSDAVVPDTERLSGDTV